MPTSRLLLQERVRLTKATAISDPTTGHMTAYGLALLDWWAANTSEAVELAALAH